MIWNKQEILEYLEKQKDADQDFIIAKKESKEGRTLAQNKYWYKLFSEISKHLWYNVDEVKWYLLAWTFGTKKLKLHRVEIEIPVISRTRDLTKEQGIFFIETILKFIKLKNIPIQITNRELDSLYESYN